MKELICKDITHQKCNVKIKGEMIEDIIDEMFAHTAEAHPKIMNELSEDEKAEMVGLMFEILSES